MNVGLAYDLRMEYLAAGYTEDETAEFDRADTIDSIEFALNELGHQTDRIGHIRNLVNRLAAGDRWDLVFSIAEGLHGIGREAQVPALLDAYEIPYTLSDPLVAALTLHKAMTKRVLRDLGIPTPDFYLVESEEDIGRVDLPFPLFVKPVAEGTAKGISATSRVTDKAELARECRRVLATYHQSALVEVFLPGREFTVGITGTGVDAVAVGTLEIILLPQAEAHSYTYVNKEQCEELCQFPMADKASAAEAEEISLAAWRGLGCRDAGRIDLRADASGRLHIMELNPLPGLHPTHSDLPMICTAVGVPYVELIRRIVDSARKRIGSPSVRQRQPMGRAQSVKT
jgi:D-alanine-D-alanine ligase